MRQNDSGLRLSALSTSILFLQQRKQINILLEAYVFLEGKHIPMKRIKLIEKNTHITY